MNVLERQRELGALRSLGMTRGQVVRLILAEAGAMGLIGGVFGLAFGLVLSQTFVVAMRSVNGYVLQYVLPLSALGAGALIAIFVSQGAALYPALKAAGVNIIEAIKHE
jgi:putative ABC transport system permease protein